MKVFVAGPRAVSRLNKDVQKRLENIIKNNLTILVGDANGIDKQVQSLCYSLNYHKVKVFASNGKARNNIGKWEVENVKVAPGTRGFNFYAAKDLEMAKNADYGFMIWNGKSRGTLNNIMNLVKLNKTVLVYLIPNHKFFTIKTNHDLELLLNSTVNNPSTSPNNSKENMEQLELF